MAAGSEDRHAAGRKLEVGISNWDHPLMDHQPVFLCMSASLATLADSLSSCVSQLIIVSAMMHQHTISCTNNLEKAS